MIYNACIVSEVPGLLINQSTRICLANHLWPQLIEICRYNSISTPIFFYFPYSIPMHEYSTVHRHSQYESTQPQDRTSIRGLSFSLLSFSISGNRRPVTVVRPSFFLPRPRGSWSLFFVFFSHTLSSTLGGYGTLVGETKKWQKQNKTKEKDGEKNSRPNRKKIPSTNKNVATTLGEGLKGLKILVGP